METKSVLILEDNLFLAASYQQVVTVLAKRNIVLAHSLDELISLRGEALSCEIGFLDIDLGSGKPSGIDAFEWLRREGFSGRLFFLTGHAADHPLVAQACAIKGAEVLRKPMGVETFLTIITGAE